MLCQGKHTTIVVRFLALASCAHFCRHTQQGTTNAAGRHMEHCKYSNGCEQFHILNTSQRCEKTVGVGRKTCSASAPDGAYPHVNMQPDTQSPD
mmetsp:Transcript_48301/g.88939  ORF Transcript_48301/g.88939 Transcript_48301/m.88939 type:complete len:94 (+) Transcript_48301:70-351(+)